MTCSVCVPFYPSKVPLMSLSILLSLFNSTLTDRRYKTNVFFFLLSPQRQMVRNQLQQVGSFFPSLTLFPFICEWLCLCVRACGERGWLRALIFYILAWRTRSFITLLCNAGIDSLIVPGQQLSLYHMAVHFIRQHNLMPQHHEDYESFIWVNNFCKYSYLENGWGIILTRRPH